MAPEDELESLIAGLAAQCFSKYDDVNLTGPLVCPLSWDSLLCWPPTLAGETVHLPCPTFDTSSTSPSGFYATRTCNAYGEWLGNRTDFTQCLQYIQENETQSWAPTAVAIILLIGSLISIIALAFSLFIFLYFSSLRLSSSLRVHSHLFAALLVQGALMTAAAAPTLFPHRTQPEWFCQSLIVLQMYSGLSCTNWMFIEGLHLHSRLTSRVFQKEAPLGVYCTFGWGFPLVCTISWSVFISHSNPRRCWSGYGRNPLIWIITGPMIAALLVNSLFLVDIIRILVSKRMASNRTSTEAEQLRKAVKATALLFPLLGIPHLLFCINPGGNGALEEAYMLANAILKSSQGFFVSILYCFMNAEVQIALRKAYMRSKSRRHCGRCGTARGTSATYVTSHSESKKAVVTAV